MAVFSVPQTDSDTDQDVSRHERTNSLPQSLGLVKQARMKRNAFATEESGDKMKKLYGQLQKQLHSLRAVVPHLSSSRRRCVIYDALEYKEQLQKQIEELKHKQNPTDFINSKQSQIDFNFSGVEVVALDGGLLIHVSCEKKPFLLSTLMAEIEGLGLSYDEVNVSCEQKLRIRAFGKQRDGSGIGADDVKRVLMGKIEEKKLEEKSLAEARQESNGIDNL